MNRSAVFLSIVCCACALALAGCGPSAKAQQDRDQGPGTGPQRSAVVPDADANHFKVDHPEQFTVATAQEYTARPELNVTGVVNPDVSRQVPVISLASGRIVEIDTRLGDVVRKGSFCLRCAATMLRARFRVIARL